MQLAHKAQTHVDDFEGRIPKARELTELTQSQDVDMATMTFYQAVRSAECNRNFVDAVDQQSIGQSTEKRITLLILPALFYQEHPEVGGDGAHVASVAGACGIDANALPDAETPLS